MQDNRRFRLSFSRLPPVWLGLCISATGGILCYLLALNRLDNDATETFTNTVGSVQFTLTGRIKSYADVLRSTSSLFQAQPALTREQFHRYVQGLDFKKQFPGIESINFAHFVREAERPAFEKKMQEEFAGLAGAPQRFDIKPAGTRPDYLVVSYIEPSTDWMQRLGADLQARKSVVGTLDNSRDTGDVATSGSPLPFPHKVITGIGMRLPVYRVNMPLDTVEQRRAAYFGSVGIGFSMERLLQGVLESQPIRNMRLVLSTASVRDDSGPKQIVLYDNAGQKDKSGTEVDSDDELSMTVPIQFSHHAWEARFSVAKRDMRSIGDVWLPVLAMATGFFSCALLFSIYHTLASSRRRALEMAREMTRELRASEAKLKHSNETLRRLAAHAENIKEGERKRIAREIHDDLGQNLLALRIEAEMLSLRTGTRHPHLHDRACQTLAQIDTTIRSVRQIINDLRPHVLDLGLNAAVAWQIADFRRRTGIACELVEHEGEIVLSDGCATALFRILQESLTNISRHAHASHVEIHLKVQQNRIAMTISDNGIGLPASAERKPGSFGLIGIEERVKILGGTVSITGSPGAGTTVAVTVPLLEHGEMVYVPRPDAPLSLRTHESKVGILT
jgi:signal transduction histidine kinase